MIPHSTQETELYIGVDEAGRGCLAGPVVAGAAIFAPGFSFSTLLPGLDDSKKLTAARRSALAPQIKEHALAWGVGLSWQGEIDSINILNATFRAMSRAVLSLAVRLDMQAKECIQPFSALALPPLRIDGSQIIPLPQWKLCVEHVCPSFAASLPESLQVRSSWPFITNLPAQKAVVRGDSRCPAIAAASILAKTTRDALMEHMEAIFPGYGFAIHKGYGTSAHLKALAAKGPSGLHRQTFRKVRPELQQNTLF